MLEIAAVKLNPEMVLLKIGQLAEKKGKIWRGTVAKALDNDSKVTEEMIKPHIEELIKKGFVKKNREGNNNERWKGKAKQVPTLILTFDGKNEFERLKAIQN